MAVAHRVGHAIGVADGTDVGHVTFRGSVGTYPVPVRADRGNGATGAGRRRRARVPAGRVWWWESASAAAGLAVAVAGNQILNGGAWSWPWLAGAIALGGVGVVVGHRAAVVLARHDAADAALAGLGDHLDLI